MKMTFAHQLSTSERDIRSYLSQCLTLLKTTHLILGCQPQPLPPLLHCDLALQHHKEQGVPVGTVHALDAVQEDSLQGDVGLLKRTRKAPSAPPNSTYTDLSSSSLELEHHAPTPSGL